MKNKNIILLLIVTAIAGVLSADVITMNSATPTGTHVGWNDAIWGDPAAAAPTTGNDYVYNKGGVWLNALGATYGSFSGDSITMDGNVALFVRGGGSLGGTLILDGGQFQNRSGITAVILGNIRVNSTSTILNISGNLDFRSGLSGAGDLRIGAFTAPGQNVTMNCIDSGYTGDFILANAGADNVSLAVQFDKSYTGAGLTFQGGNLLRTPVYQLTNDISFLSVSMPSAENASVMVNLDIGTYDAAELAAAGVNSAYYNDLGGTLTVIPEPATMGLVGVVGAALLVVRRRFM